jgi:hypothetical protein
MSKFTPKLFTVQDYKRDFAGRPLDELEPKKKEEVFDDITTDTDEDALQWSQVCVTCAKKEEVLAVGKISSDSGEEICGVIS